jgi:hypothetical protein
MLLSPSSLWVFPPYLYESQPAAQLAVFFSIPTPVMHLWDFNVYVDDSFHTMHSCYFGLLKISIFSSTLLQLFITYYTLAPIKMAPAPQFLI